MQEGNAPARPNKELIRFANTALIVGGVLVSASTRLSAMPEVFCLFLAGHLIWLFHAIRTHDRGLMALNIGMALLDLFAICIRINW